MLLSHIINITKSILMQNSLWSVCLLFQKTNSHVSPTLAAFQREHGAGLGAGQPCSSGSRSCGSSDCQQL